MSNIEIKKGDMFVIAIIILLAIAIFFFFGRGTKQGEFGEIWQGNNLVKRVKLSDGFKEIYKIDGAHNQIIEIDGKKMRFLESDCPNQVCVHTGWISKTGQVAVCLPNKVIIKIVGGESDVDVIVG